MSKLGKTPIPLPKGVEIKSAEEGLVHIKGPKGSLQLTLPKGIAFKIDAQLLTVSCDEMLVENRALHGLYRSLMKSSVVGVTEGFEKRLSLVGVGFRAAVAGNRLDLQVGFSHPTFVIIPKGIEVVVDKGILIVVKGMNKHDVGQFAASVRAIKPPEPYKGKGIRYENEYVRKKEGKAAKAAAAAAATK
jgi:large subunit ribosomal protein L6